MKRDRTECIITIRMNIIFYKKLKLDGWLVLVAGEAPKSKSALDCVGASFPPLMKEKALEPPALSDPKPKPPMGSCLAGVSCGALLREAKIS